MYFLPVAFRPNLRPPHSAEPDQDLLICIYSTYGKKVNITKLLQNLFIALWIWFHTMLVLLNILDSAVSNCLIPELRLILEDPFDPDSCDEVSA